jgi:hypothetical protein
MATRATVRRLVTLLAVLCLALAAAVQPVGAKGRPDPHDHGVSPVRGWTILSDSDKGADEVIAAAPKYDINHLQISHEIVHDLREVREEKKRVQANRITAAAHRAGTFIETGARVERQHSTKLKTEEAKLAHLVDQVADVVGEERGLGLYLRTFGYFPQEMERTIKAIDLVTDLIAVPRPKT